MSRGSKMAKEAMRQEYTEIAYAVAGELPGVEVESLSTEHIRFTIGTKRFDFWPSSQKAMVVGSGGYATRVGKGNGLKEWLIKQITGEN